MTKKRLKPHKQRGMTKRRRNDKQKRTKIKKEELVQSKKEIVEKIPNQSRQNLF